MALPPIWKVKREIRRARENIAHRLHFFPFSDQFRQYRYDRNLPRLLRETPGALPITKRVAVFVLYQPRGVAQSVLFTLRHLFQEGWSVIVVSNTSLTTDDRSQLVLNSSHVIERPNTGYDFGAYREGWRWLLNMNHPIDRLILMNDSTWFPLRMEDDSLRRMEALNVDLAGHIFKTELSNDPSHDHMEAHLLMFGPRAISHPAIRKFWSDYLMSDSRSSTIARGEKGVTQTARSAGLVVRGLLDRERIVGILSQLSNVDLLRVVANLVVDLDEDRERRSDWLAAAASHQPWRDDFLAWADHELANSRKQLLSTTFVDPAVRLGGMGFIKKAKDQRFQLARMMILRELELGRIPAVDPILFDEISEITRNWEDPQSWKRDPSRKHETLEL
jgi:hypothetical protein